MTETATDSLASMENKTMSKSDSCKETDLIESEPVPNTSVLTNLVVYFTLFLHWVILSFIEFGGNFARNGLALVELGKKFLTTDQESKTATVTIIENSETCEKVLLENRANHPHAFNFLGMDCEWNSQDGRSNCPIALLQLATPSNDCFLIRLSKMSTPILPISLKTVLEDRRILKFGVGIMEDAKKLASQYGVNVCGCVDLRHVVLRCRRALEKDNKEANADERGCGSSVQRLGLRSLAERIIGVMMDKHWKVRCSNWEAEELNRRQVEYAANDALVAIHVFLQLVILKGEEIANRGEGDFTHMVSDDTAEDRNICEYNITSKGESDDIHVSEGVVEYNEEERRHDNESISPQVNEDSRNTLSNNSAGTDQNRDSGEQNSISNLTYGASAQETVEDSKSQERLLNENIEPDKLSRSSSGKGFVSEFEEVNSSTDDKACSRNGSKTSFENLKICGESKLSGASTSSKALEICGSTEYNYDKKEQDFITPNTQSQEGIASRETSLQFDNKVIVETQGDHPDADNSGLRVGGLHAENAELQVNLENTVSKGQCSLDESKVTKSSESESSSSSSDDRFLCASNVLEPSVVTMDLKKLEIKSKESPGYITESNNLISDPMFRRRAMSLCQGIVDLGFKQKCNKKQKKHSTVNGDEKDVCRQQRKERYIIQVKKNLPYSKCILQAPDGARLCTLGRKKADWYLVNHLGELVAEDPYTVRLKFEPAGRPKSKEDYYLTFKENVCVVCGKSETFLSKSIVPRDYRQHFPPCLKEHHSHDILVMCPPCHRIACDYDLMFRQKLAEEFGAPIGNKANKAVARLVIDQNLKKVQFAAKAIVYSGAKLPAKRKEELLKIVQEFYGEKDVTEEMLQAAATTSIKKLNCDYKSHGEEVVKKVLAQGKLLEFERAWRQHFLDTMSPRYLPPYWSVDHRHDDLREKLNM